MRRLAWAVLVLLLSGPAAAAGLIAEQRSLLLEQQRLSREATLARMQQIRFAFREMPAPGQRWALWSRGYGLRGEHAGDSAVDDLTLRAEGWQLGLDRPLGGQWMGGLLVGGEHSRAEADAGSHLNTRSDYLGLYATTRIYHQLGLRLGLLHAWQRLQAEGVDTRLHGRARSLQLFGEASYAMDFRTFTVEPFAGLSLQRSDFASSRVDGAQPLWLGGAVESGSRLELGWRLMRPWTLGDSRLVGRASLALRQRLDDDRLSVSGRNAAGAEQRLQARAGESRSLRLDLGLDRELGRGRYLGLGYSAHLARGEREHLLAARLSLRF